MISVKEATDTILRNTRRQPAVEVEFLQGVGKILAQDVRSDIDMPPFHRSMMDGYAVRAEDVQAVPRVLDVVGFIAAGAYPKFTLSPGQAAKIMTGAPLPAGANAVREIEKVREYKGGEKVEILESVQPWENVVQKGAEISAGETVLAAGTFIDAATIGLLAATGNTRIKVYQTPEVAILATGDELVDPHIRPVRGQIRNSNSFTLAALCRKVGVRSRILGTAKDDKSTLQARIQKGLQSDVLILTGGVSVGELDLVQEVLQQLGATIFFEKVAIKPGKPTIFAKWEEKYIFALPGNPVSSATVFEVMVRPALRKMMGYPVYQNPQVRAILTQYFVNKSGRENYHPSVTWYEDGRFYCRPLGTKGSGDIATYAKSNSFLICPIEIKEIDENSEVEVLLRENYYLR